MRKPKRRRRRFEDPRPDSIAAVRHCTKCGLSKTRDKLVWGRWHCGGLNSAVTVLQIGEAPGKTENANGLPFSGKTGRENTNLLNRIGLTAGAPDHSPVGVYITNALKCHPPGDRDPKPHELKACQVWLHREISILQPDIIITSGKIALTALAGVLRDPDELVRIGTNLQVVHGIPMLVESGIWSGIVLPAYHPAAGLHNQAACASVQGDFAVLGRLVRAISAGRTPRIEPAVDPYASEYQCDYAIADGGLPGLPDNPGLPGCPCYPGRLLVAVDTETHGDVDPHTGVARPESMQISTAPGTAVYIRADDRDAIASAKALLESPGTLTILHNAIFDVQVLAALGIRPSAYIDTMIMAYLLQDEPLGLKPLAYRHAGLLLKEYADIVAPDTHRKAMLYLARVVEHDWPDPEPVLEWKRDPDGGPPIPHIKQPQNIRTKAARILVAQHAKGTDPYAAWNRIPLSGGRGMVEAAFGPMRIGSLSGLSAADPNTAVLYACLDADATLQVYTALAERFTSMSEADAPGRDWAGMLEMDSPPVRLSDTRSPRLWQVLLTDCAIVDTAIAMRSHGIPADADYFRQLSPHFEEAMADLEDRIEEESGIRINPGSHDDVRRLLFEELLLPPGKLTPGGVPSTSDDVLPALESHHPVVGLIRKHRAYSKLLGTYASPMSRHIHSDGRVHASIGLTNTATGRLSTSSPNLMAIPVRSAEGRLIRLGYCAEPDAVLASMDYSQIELRVMAHEAADPIMIEVFQHGKDIHTRTAAEVFGVSLDRVDKYQHRRPAKTVNFGIPYGMGAEGLHETLAADGADMSVWTLDRCEEFIEEWFRLYPGVRAYMDRIHAQARRYGYVTDMWGRVRLIPGVRYQDRRVVAEALRQAGNMPIQSGAQGVIKLAMARMREAYPRLHSDAPGHCAYPVLQIHDDNMSMLGMQVLPVAVPVLLSIMESAVELRVPTPVDADVGVYWGALRPYRDGITREELEEYGRGLRGSIGQQQADG